MRQSSAVFAVEHLRMEEQRRITGLQKSEVAPGFRPGMTWLDWLVVRQADVDQGNRDPHFTLFLA